MTDLLNCQTFAASSANLNTSSTNRFDPLENEETYLSNLEYHRLEDPSQ